MASPTPTPYVSPSTSYDLVATLDYYQHSLSVVERLTYFNSSPETLDTLLLVIEPNRWENGFTLLSLAWQGGGMIANYELDGDQLSIPLSDSLEPGESLALQVEYELELPLIPPHSEATRPQPYGYTTRQTNIVDWYPYIPPYIPGEGWLAHSHWWFGEHQVYEIADFDVSLSLAEPVTDLVIAASAPASRDGDVYRYHLESARTFALSVSNQYQVHSTSVGGVDVYSYSFPYDTYSGQEVFTNTVAALELYSQLLIAYPYPSLSVVEADFLDGMEYSGLFFLSNGFYNLYDGTPKGYLTFIAAHETAHQWWYGVVGNDQALEPWLDEALCTYMEHIFYENLYADYPPGSNESLVDWWQYYRVDFYEPSGWIDGSIYDYDRFLAYRNSVYLNGANFFQDLRTLVGDEEFFAFLRSYARQFTGRIASSEDFFSLLRQNTTQDLDALVERYFESPIWP